MITNDRDLNSYVIQYFKEKHIDITELAETVVELQKDHIDGLTVDDCEMAINQVLKKREVLYAMATGINLDKLAKSHKLDFPVQNAIINDYGLYGVDETIALSMTKPYGSIAITNYGYLDKVKFKTAKRLDDMQREHRGKVVNTFLDDIVSAIIADASALIAHNEDEFTGEE